MPRPLTRYYPALFSFLGYDPFPSPQSLAERIAQKRRQLGLTIAQVAAMLDVDVETFAKWESGAWRPRMSKEKVERFLILGVSRGVGRERR